MDNIGFKELAKSYIDSGWRDLTSELMTRSGSSAPSLAQYRNGIYLYAFPDNLSKEVFANFHVDHDYKRGSLLYPHMHWSPNTATASGTVRWGFEYTVAKGHGQESFPATTTVYSTHTITENSQYKHFITEVSDDDAIDGTDIEPDTVIMMRVFRDVANDDFADAVLGITMDLHYLVDRFCTKNKAPNFYL